MIRENNLLPWIMGGLSLAAIAVAVTVSSTIGSASRKLPTPVPAAVSAPAQALLPAAAPISVLPPAPAPVPATAPPADPTLALDPVQPAGAPMASENQIWECTTNGQRTFSDKPCGSNATLREMNPLNVMSPAPRSPPTYPYPPESGNAPDYYYPDGPDGQDVVSSSYPVVVGYPYAVHRRPEHPQRPYHPQSVPLPRAVAAPRRN